MKYCYLILSLFFTVNVGGQTPHNHLRKGDKNYNKKEYQQAEERYRKAIEKDKNSLNGVYNLGNTMYNQRRFDEAIKHYEDATGLTADPALKSGIYHNLGNAYIAQQQKMPDQQKSEMIEKGINAYKDALRLNPNDPATRYNLAYAQHLLKRLNQQPPPQSDQQQKQDNDNQSEDKNDNSTQQDNQNDEQQKPKNEQQKEEDKEDERPKPQPKDLSKEEAQKLLDIMNEEERKVQEKLKKKKGKRVRTNKDW